MQNKLRTKKVGKVDIFELEGLFTGKFASLAKYAFEQYGRDYLLLNLEKTEDIDAQGAQVIAESFSPSLRGAVLKGRPEVEKRLADDIPSDRIRFLRTEEDAARHFAKEFAWPADEDTDGDERRMFIRLKTVLPLQFGFDLESGKRQEFFGVVTNLSEGGLFTEFIESRSEDESKKFLNPYDLRMLDLKLHLPGIGPLEVSGKMIHGNGEGGLGISFYGIQQEHQDCIAQWVESHLMENMETES